MRMNSWGRIRISGPILLLLCVRWTFAALSCYGCYSDQTVGLKTKLEPFAVNVSGVSCAGTYPSSKSTCQGLACFVIKNDLDTRGYTLESTCINPEDTYRNGFNIPIPTQAYSLNLSITPFICDALNYYQSEYKFYYFAKMCCFTVQQYSNETNTFYNRTYCACVNDYCNANMTEFLLSTNGPSPSAMGGLADRLQLNQWCLYGGILVFIIDNLLGLVSRFRP